MTRSVIRRLTLAFALVLAAFSGLAFASSARTVDIEVPKNDGWVTDTAGLLTPEQERSLEALMESYKQGTTHEIALLTVPDLKGEPIERFALDVGRAWGLGTKDKNNGALLVVSKADRALRIEVGRGLEGNLTDSISGRIIRDVIVPQFRNGDFAGGLRQGVEAMHAAIGGDYGQLPRAASKRRVGALEALAKIALFAFLIFVFLLVHLSRRTRRASPLGMLGDIALAASLGRSSRSGRSSGGGFGGGGFSGFGGGGGFSGGGASGRW